jgi:hypothetical protein
MSEEQRQHPQEPAEGSEQDAGAPGADRAGNDAARTAESAPDEAGPPRHPSEPAEGGEEDVEAPGAERARKGG